MRILGVDPGLRVCGYACLHTSAIEYELVEAGVFRTEGHKSIELRLNQIAEDIKSLLDKFAPDIVAVEKLYSHYRHPKTAILMGQARGVILQKCAEAGATRIKKSITGNGRASKGQVQRTIKTVLALSEVPKPSDVADAIATALCCANSNISSEE